MDREAWLATVHRVAKSQVWSDLGDTRRHACTRGTHWAKRVEVQHVDDAWLMMDLVDYPDHSVPVPQNQEGKNYISQTPLQVGLGSTKPDMVEVKWSQQMKRESSEGKVHRFGSLGAVLSVPVILRAKWLGISQSCIALCCAVLELGSPVALEICKLLNAPCEHCLQLRTMKVKSESESRSVVSNSLWSHGLYSAWNSPGQNMAVGSLSLLQGIFPTKGSNPGLPHCRRILYQLSYNGSPRILEWVAYPFSSGSSHPRNLTGVSYIAGRFLTNWAMREAQGLIFIFPSIRMWIPKEQEGYSYFSCKVSRLQFPQ